MKSKVSVLGHPIHPMLIPFPVAFYTGTLLSYVVAYAATSLFWYRMGIVLNAAGIAFAVVAAVPGFLDWYLGVPRDSPARGEGVVHMGINLSALAFFSINLILQAPGWDTFAPGTISSVLLAFIGVYQTIGAGLLGWHLVQTHHIGIEEARPTPRLVYDRRRIQIPVEFDRRRHVA